MSSVTSEIRRNAKLEIFTRDGAVALYEEKGSKHQDQLSQSDSAARKSQPLIHTAGAEGATHVSSVVLRDKFGKKRTHGKGIRFDQKKEERSPPPLFLPAPLFLFFDCDPPFFCSLVSCLLESEFHTKRDATCSRAALAVRGNLEVDRELKHPSDVRHSPAAERPGHYYARLAPPFGRSSEQCLCIRDCPKSLTHRRFCSFL